MRDKYATKASTSAAGNGCWGARRYRTERTGAPVSFENWETGTRCVQGSIKLFTQEIVSVAQPMRQQKSYK